MADQPDRANVQITLDRVLLSEVDRLATLWNLYRYEALEELLALALKQVKAENYKPKKEAP